MAIVAKNKAVIVPKYALHYDPATFEEHKDPRFMEATAEQVLEQIRPITFDFLPGRSLIAVDTETYFTGIANNRMPSNVVRRWVQQGSKYHPNDFPFCISISDGQHSFAVYDTLQNGFKEFLKLVPLLFDPTIDKCGHNMDYDLHMLANSKVNMRGRFYDTMHLSKLTRADAFTHNLCDVADEINCEAYPTVTKFEHMLDSYKAQYRITDYRMFPRELMTQYTCADTWNAIWAFAALYPRMIANEQLPLFETESATMLVTFHMERDGVYIEPEYEHVLIPELEKELEDAERAIYETAGCTFNINSSQQLYGVLEKLGYSHLVHFTKPTEAMLAKGITKGNPCFKANEMERLEEEGVPLISEIMTYRKAEKLLNTFAYKLYEMRDFNNVVHCNINTMEAKTGRFSISAPSMQNMPRRKDSRVRGAFIAPPGFTLYDFDFKAQESLIMAHYSRAPYLLSNINKGLDIHKVIAAIIYNIPFEKVTKDLRNIAKSIEFAIVYGAGADKVKAMTSDVVIDGKKGLTLEEARAAITTFKKNVPEVDIFIKTANNTIKERGCIRTIMGRRVYSERGREYACVNYLCQGSAAASTKTRMVEIYKFLRANNYKTRMILQVHDSLLQQVWDEEIEKGILGYLRWLQTERNLFRVTVQVDVAKCAPTWRDKVDVDVACVEPPADQLEKMRSYDIWNDGILD
jgi:DNA polymerase-1